jgi:DNA processing protein
MITSAADIIYLLNWELEQKETKPIQRELFIELDDVEKTIYSYLQKEGKQLLDSIALDCKLPIFKVSSTLFNMEMKGIVRPLPGKLFEVI